MAVTYFAYGANMAEDVMAAFCPGHRPLGSAELPGHRLAFSRRSIRTGTGVADVVPDPGASVWGVLYELSDSDIDGLDRKEGNGWAYERVPVVVRAGPRWDEEVAAVTYRVCEREPAEVEPSRDYLDGLIAAAHARGLPPAYSAELEARRA
ncbi:MAG TPA: gamma-glutamylcyclotransferase family protein [Thermoleophilaceae bacterium]|nr:gamma-glutamylcyclotransferase family protein [Thermoleophilaceae bacterium]